MANTKQKKLNIFLKYSENLNYLKSRGYLRNIVLSYESTYICPICLRQFCEKDLDDSAPNQLTLEHVPPESSGGKGIILTCAQCNNGAGATCDGHLAKWLREKDEDNLDVNSITKAKIFMKSVSKPLNSIIDYKANPNGIGSININVMHNHPDLIKEFYEERGKVNIDIEIPVKADFYQVETAILKSAYLLMFARFGYSFLFDEVFDLIRRQLLGNNNQEYFTGYHCNEVYEKFPDGVFISKLYMAEGFNSILSLVTPAGIVYRYAVHLPIPYTDREQTLRAFVEAESMSIERPWGNWDFLFNSEHIIGLHDWFMQVGISHIKSKGYRGINFIFIK